MMQSSDTLYSRTSCQLDILLTLYITEFDIIMLKSIVLFRELPAPGRCAYLSSTPFVCCCCFFSEKVGEMRVVLV